MVEVRGWHQAEPGTIVTPINSIKKKKAIYIANQSDSGSEVGNGVVVGVGVAFGGDVMFQNWWCCVHSWEHTKNHSEKKKKKKITQLCTVNG